MTFINTNISALRAAAANTANEVPMQSAMQRLSTGKRINSASDDAAGSAIAAKMSANIASLNQAVRNAYDGISMIQTAESDMSAVNNAMQRMRTLAVQCASGTNGASDRDTLQTEYAQMMSEIERVAANYKFNGIALSSASAQAFQVGPGSTPNDQISVTIGAFDSNALHIDTSAIAALVAPPNPGPTVATTSGTSSAAETSAVTFVPLFAGQSVSVAGRTLMASGAITAADVAAAFSSANTTPSNGTLTGTLALFTASAASTATVTFTSTTANTDVTNISISSSGSGPSAAITALDAGIQTLSGARAGLGAVQNRLSQAVQSLQANSTNLSAARSRIEDTDYGTETTALARAQILAQASNAMLAQANQLGQSVLALLK